MDNFNTYSSPDVTNDIQSLNKYTTKTFALMFLGVIVTFATSIFAISSGIVYSYINMTNNMLFIFLPFILQLIIIVAIRKKAQNLNSSSATGMFFIYSILQGIVICPLLVFYGAEVAILAFLGAAFFFGGMALYGFVTKRDLLKLAPVFTIGIISLLLYNVVAVLLSFAGINLIGSGLDLVMGSIGLLLFVGLTAFDVQKMKKLYYSNVGDERRLKSASIISAVELYLDFMGIFIYLLRIFGRSRN